MEIFQDRIIVLDSYPSSGKTSWAIQYMNELPEDTKIVYLTPYLDEVNRILTSCSKKKFIQPDIKNGRGSKMNHLIQLITNGENIVSTHALFSMINDKLISSLRINNYILILDEVFQTVERFDIVEEKMNNEQKDAITKRDVETLKESGHIKIESDFRITWIDYNKPLSKYSNLMNLCERELIYFVNGSLLLWTFPIEVFREGIFDQIFILTHRFESQLQSYYYKYFDLQYTKYIVYKNNNRYEIKQGDSNIEELSWKEEIKNKIHIIDNPKLNKPGDVYMDARNHPYKSSLSKSWYASESNDGLVKTIKSNLISYYQYLYKTKANERLWTCFKEELPTLKSRYISPKSWLACNARATNNYGDKIFLAYLINRYVDPFYDDFFIHKNIVINQDEYALSEMMQWIWRSAIRNGKEITVYMPSQRMRTILKKYFDNEKIEF